MTGELPEPATELSEQENVKVWKNLGQFVDFRADA
jgi:hypothetical protein